MADEMEAIRAKRMAELSQQYGVRRRQPAQQLLGRTLRRG
jgi:DNA-binding TFAR19-related protein (PDSD5 family)